MTLKNPLTRRQIAVHAVAMSRMNHLGPVLENGVQVIAARISDMDVQEVSIVVWELYGMRLLSIDSEGNIWACSDGVENG